MICKRINVEKIKTKKNKKIKKKHLSQKKKNKTKNKKQKQNKKQQTNNKQTKNQNDYHGLNREVILKTFDFFFNQSNRIDL